MSRICVIGAGYVGLVSAACLAKLGHQVVCVEADAEKVRAIQQVHLPIKEPYLESLWERFQRLGQISITSSYADALHGAEFVFLCVGTPPNGDGSADLSHVLVAARSIADSLQEGQRPVVVVKSTVPVGTGDRLHSLFQDLLPPAGLAVVSNPEFLREGQGVNDFLHPDRIVIGAREAAAAQAVAGLFVQISAPVIHCDSRTAELIKYTSNAFLATKVSFINQIAELADACGVDITTVSRALGLDHRIGGAYLQAGLGWGGSCLPKDLAALVNTADQQGVANELLVAVQEVNRRQPELLIQKLDALIGPLDGVIVVLLGLTFKPACDDLRESPALRLARALAAEGCEVRAYDPAVSGAIEAAPWIALCRDPYTPAIGADVIILATAWDEFQLLDFRRLRGLMRGDLLVDGRNALDPEAVTSAGLTYMGIGRPRALPRVAGVAL
ncbi:MAG TPA: UDP-glucose/GDP-mannose dehydrogenase family protein [Dehalococcoidia bacterium]|nr:UDP-glucose/GDP-mannose dehydrogenase family protein [Dehalococcoidia bacterium]